jgi:hypothetical protein
MATIEKLQRDVRKLQKEVALLRRSRTVTVPITTLEPEPYELVTPISIVLRPDEGGGFIASYFDANVNASGDNEQDAVANFKDILVSLYEILTKEEHRLGRGLGGQLAVLRTIIRRKSGDGTHHKRTRAKNRA